MGLKAQWQRTNRINKWCLIRWAAIWNGVKVESGKRKVGNGKWENGKWEMELELDFELELNWEWQLERQRSALWFFAGCLEQCARRTLCGKQVAACCGLLCAPSTHTLPQCKGRTAGQQCAAPDWPQDKANSSGCRLEIDMNYDYSPAGPHLSFVQLCTARLAAIWAIWAI